MQEMGRVLKPQAKAVIEVGEVQTPSGGKNLDQLLAEQLPLKINGATLRVKESFINLQNFTKLSNCWSVHNNKKGTNTNRCLVLEKIPLQSVS